MASNCNREEREKCLRKRRRRRMRRNWRERRRKKIGKREKGSVRYRGMRHRVRGGREKILEKNI